MPECEKFQQIFHNSVDFDLQKDCHIIISSSFDNLLSPVDIDSPNIKQTLVIAKSKFSKCFEVPINFLSNEGIFQLTRTCYSRGRGFLNKNFEKTGMFLYASCKSLDTNFSSFSFFDGFGKISQYISNSNGKVNNYNESFNRLSDYASIYFYLSESSASFISLANTTGAITGIEFNRAQGKSSLLRNVNIINVIIFSLPDINGNAPGIVVATTSETHLKVENIYFARCMGSYFVKRIDSTISYKNIFCDEKIDGIDVEEFVSTVNIDTQIVNCNMFFEHKTRSNSKCTSKLMCTFFLFAL